MLREIIWGWPTLGAILLAGANYSFRLGFFQIRCCGLWMKTALSGILSSHGKRGGQGGITQLQALTTALAGSIGTGNIVGVATALTVGGPGAIFWMWISALLGMATIFAENVLGMKYRVRDKDGQWHGGAMYYLERGAHCRPLAFVFAGACALASFGMGNMAQTNSIAQTLDGSFGIPPTVTGVVLCVLILFVIFGGIRRVARVTEKLVPIMAAGYLAACAVILIVCHDQLGDALRSILNGAFGIRPAAGGISGALLLNAMQCGVSRGIFTNEAGLGSSVMAHAGSDGKDPVEQGMWGIFQVFLDTIVMCTVTALVILCTGVLSTGLDGAYLSAAAFTSVFGDAGAILVSVSIALFAFATLLGWSYYGEQGIRYLTGGRGIPLFRILFAGAAFLGCTMDLQSVWEISDIFNGFLALPNLAALFLLSGEVVDETHRYLADRKDIPPGGRNTPRQRRRTQCAEKVRTPPDKRSLSTREHGIPRKERTENPGVPVRAQGGQRP